MMKKKWIIAVLGMGWALGGWAEPHAQVQLEYGMIQGNRVGTTKKTYAFLGIPYARPPVGKLRWQPPQAVRSWENVRDCTRFGPSCPQPKSFFPSPPGAFSENCLYLNVWTPNLPLSQKQKCPVMIWIHGGGFTTGSGASPSYDGRRLVESGVVLVTINYRLGPFGFFAHPALSAESAHGVSGNYGLLDQIAALKWVKRNIAMFGGDPGNVTIFGESAGAVSVGCLLVSPLAKGLFQRAILESGVPWGIRQWLKKTTHGQPSMEQVGVGIASRLGVDETKQTAAALRRIPAAVLLTKANPRVGLFGKGTKIGPCVDGYVLPDTPEKLFRSGRFHPVPVLVGTNADEGSIFVKYQLPVHRVFGYRLILRLFFLRAEAQQVEAMYPVTTDSEAQPQLIRVVTDSVFLSSTRRFCRAVAGAGKASVYQYYFTRVCPGARRLGVGAMHAGEIFYVFGTRSKRYTFTEVDEGLSDAMRTAWVRFATSGNPNGGKLPAWPVYRLADEAYLEFGDRIQVKHFLHKDACDLFDRIGFRGKTGQPAKQKK